MARVCTGCGVVVDGSGNLSINGVQTAVYPYAAQTTTPGDIYCDSASNELWIKPWAVPWGVIGTSKYATNSSQQVNSNVDVAITGFAITWNALAGRQYKVSLGGSIYNGSLVTTIAGSAIWLDGVTTGTRVISVSTTMGSGGYGNVSQTGYLTTTTGSHTLQVALSSNPAVTFVGFNTSAVVPIWLILEDIGPA